MLNKIIGCSALWSGKNKKKLNYNLKVAEALEIKKANCGPGRGLNENLSLSSLSASDEVSQSGFENLGKLMFCFLHCISIMKLQVFVLNIDFEIHFLVAAPYFL